MSIEGYLNTLTDAHFKPHVIDGGVYFLHTIEITERNVGKERLLVSYKAGDEENVHVHVTNILNKCDNTIMNLLLQRWTIEVWHRDAKQHLGLEDYQVRKYRGIQKVVPAILLAYTQVILMRKDAILQSINRVLTTIGEGCRYLRLIALKGWSWLKKKAKDQDELTKILNGQVFVKNAKV